MISRHRHFVSLIGLLREGDNEMVLAYLINVYCVGTARGHFVQNLILLHIFIGAARWMPYLHITKANNTFYSQGC